MKRVYICSPYTNLVSMGDDIVRYAAISAMHKANFYYRNEKIELYSPVLDNMYKCEGLSHDEAMKICFDELIKCDEIFICEVVNKNSIKHSKGIKMEYEFAKKQNIPVVILDEWIKKFYEDRQ